MRVFILSILLTFSFSSLAQKLDSLRFCLYYGSNPIKLNSYFAEINSSDSILISKIQFYISLPERVGGRIQPIYKLIDFQERDFLCFPKLKKLGLYRFKLGVDSNTNLTSKFSGDLDPLNGMYWTWQNGFIHFKLEGKIKFSINPEKKFEFHLGGYLKPNNSAKEIEADMNDIKGKVVLDSKPFFDEVLSSRKYEVRIPGKDANKLMEILANSFKFK